MKKRLLTIGIILAAVCVLALAIVFLLPEKPADNSSLTILQQPAVSAGEDENVSVSLTAEGENLTYQWYVWDEKLQDYVKSSQTGAVYHPDAEGEYKVYCVITDAKGNSVQSETVVFTVKAPEPPHTHSYKVEEIPATCTTNAVFVYRCACGEEYTEEKADSKLPHSFTKYLANNDATCTADGTKTAKCDYCNAKNTRTVKNSKLPHSFTEYHSDNNATCTADGTETAKCNGCDATDTRTEVNSKLSHSFTEYHSDNNATCTKDGTETAKCDNCDAINIRTVKGSKLPHSFTAYHSDNNASCTADGTETAKCDNCDAINIRTVKGSKLPHSFTAYHSDNNATCTADGTETAKCDHCDATDTRVVPGSGGHNYVAGSCQRCGDTPVGVKITKQPTSITIVGGLSGSVSVMATGDGLTYEWYYKDTNSDVFVRAAATGSTYTITMTNNADGRQAYCVVRDQYDNSVQSDTVTFTKKETTSGSGATGEEGDIFIPF